MRIPGEEELAVAIEQLDAHPRVTVNTDETKTLELLEPIKSKGQEVTHVTFRKPTGRDWLETDKEVGEIGKGFRLAAALGGLSYGSILGMCGEDALMCTQVASSMGKKLATGGTF